ncbi:MAG: PTS fructose transporter subunit IIA [Deltaproteobacteria bacterium]|nr:MAG: PTS fructose transporter subunit IIA [Deltaproteobacteria bacterium]
MRLLDVIPKEAVLPDLRTSDKKGTLEELAAPLAPVAGVEPSELVRILMEREQLGSTGIGNGVGIPHGKLKGLDTLYIGFGRSRNGVRFDSLDGRPVHLFFLLITPEDSTGIHLKILAQLSKYLRDEHFREQLLQAETPEDILAVIEAKDEDF